jgi:hypothetical protein
MNKTFVFILFVLFVFIAFIHFYNTLEELDILEMFTSGNLEQMKSQYPDVFDNLLVKDSYPVTGKKGVSDETSNNMWWRYPIFKVGSYEQKTNNLRYPINPDDARCTPGEFCFALYNNYKRGSNIITQLPPVNPDCGTRVGYFNTGVNLLPYRTNMQNILY